MNFIWNKNCIWLCLISPLFVYKANTKSRCIALEWLFVQWIDQWTWKNPTDFVLYPPSKSSITMTSSGLNESGQQVMFVHHNNFALSLMNVWDITSYMYDHPAVILAKLTPQEQLSLQGTFGVWTDAKVLWTKADEGM